MAVDPVSAAFEKPRAALPELLSVSMFTGLVWVPVGLTLTPAHRLKVTVPAADAATRFPTIAPSSTRFLVLASGFMMPSSGVPPAAPTNAVGAPADTLRKYTLPRYTASW